MNEFDILIRKIAFDEGTYPPPRPKEESVGDGDFDIPEETPMQELYTSGTEDEIPEYEDYYVPGKLRKYNSYKLYINKLAGKGYILPALFGSLGLAAWLSSGKAKNTVEKSVLANPFLSRKQQLEDAEKLIENPGG